MRKFLLSLLLVSVFACTSLAQNCSINAGLSTSICLSDSMKLYGTRSGLSSPNTHPKWTQLSGSPVTILRPDSLITAVTGYTPGTYTFKLSNKCLDGITSEDTISITVSPLTLANAGRDTTLCPGNTYALNANKPLLANETGLWTFVTNGLGITINSPADPNSTLTLSGSFPGISKLRWTITNSNGCISFDDVIITNCGGISPVNAGPDQTLDVCYMTTTCTKLVATNGGNGTGNQTGAWSFISGPTVPIMSQLNSPTTIVCNLSEGTYVFRYTVNGPCANGSDEVSIIVPPASQSIPKISPIGNVTICDGISAITVTGNNPSNVNEVVQWTQTYGPAIVHFNTPNNPSTIVTGFTKPGLYIFNYNITNSNSGCSGNGEVRCMLYESGTVDAGPDQILPCNVTEATIPVTTTGFGYLYYRIVSGPRNAFTYPTQFLNSNVIKGLTYAAI